MFEYYSKTMSDYVMNILLKVTQEEGEGFINNFIKQTNNWKIFSNWMNKIFTYLDRFYTKEKKIKNLFYISMTIYKTQVIIYRYNE
jgi:hypothetical protein